MFARATTLWTILRISLEERLVYRGDFALGTLMRFLPIVTQIFLWTAIFSAVGGKVIAGYTRDDMIAYYLMTMIGRAFSSMPGLATGIAREVREGTIKKYLIQPIDLISFLLMQRIAHKLVYYGVAAAPFALVFFLCRGFFPPAPSGEVMAAFAACCIMAFLLGFYIESTMGLIAFWFLEVTSLLFVFNLFTFFFSGHMFPLDLLPYPWSIIVDSLPLKYLAYFPAAVWLGKVEGDALWTGLGIQAAWLAGFMLLNRWLFNRGVRRYSGFGG